MPFCRVGNGYDRSTVPACNDHPGPVQRDTSRPHRRGGALTRPPADGNGKTAPVGRVGRRGRRPLRSSELFVGIRRGRPPGRPTDAKGIGKKKDQPKITTSLRGAKRRGNPHLSGPGGAGRRVAPQGLRIATPLRARNDGDNRWLVLLF